MAEDRPAEIEVLRSYRAELEAFLRRALLERWTFKQLLAETSTLPETARDAFVYVAAELAITALRRRLDEE